MEKYRFDRKPNIIILTLYLLLIVFSFVFVFVTDNCAILTVVAVAGAVLLWFAARLLLGFVAAIPDIGFCGSEDPDTGKLLKVFGITSATAFLLLMIWFIGYRPGSFQGDCVFQYKQAITGQYTDWHPAWQTFLFYTIPLKLTGGALWSMTFYQMFWFSIVMGYISTVIYRFAGIRWMAGIYIYIMFNPYTGQMILYPWKDCAFAMAGAVAMAMAASIVFTKGRWADKNSKCIMLGIFLANCTIFRHNAIIFTAVLLIALLFYVKRKSGIIIVGAFVLSYLIIQGPVNRLLNVEPDPQTVVQAVGLPMTIIGNVTKETPEKLDEETADFVYSMAEQETWESDYELGNFGVMKYYGNIDMTPIEERGTLEVTQMALRCIARSPKASFRALLALTDIVYGIDQKDEGYIGSQIVDNECGIMYQGNERVAAALMTYYKLIRLHGYNFTRQFAFLILLLLIFVLGRSDLSKIGDWRRILPVLCVFTYSFGTMLLLTSADSRFFYIDYLTCPLATIMMLIPSERFGD